MFNREAGFQVTRGQRLFWLFQGTKYLSVAETKIVATGTV